MDKNIKYKLDLLVKENENIINKINCSSTIINKSLYRTLIKRYKQIKPIIDSYNSLNKLKNEINLDKDLLFDPLLKKLAEDEIKFKEKEINKLKKIIKNMLFTSNIKYSNNIFLEIRAGTGGNESSLFVNDLSRMYLRYAERKNWKCEILSYNESILGGYKEIIIRVIGKNVYKNLKFESGVHRVQRIPITETQGRIHTSTCTVAIIPEIKNNNEIVINSDDLRIDTFRASGSGGQHINKTDSAVRITHLKSGIVVECQSDRSQHKNKSRALKILISKIKNQKYKEQKENKSKIRKSLIGSGDRSERIRTYNFPRGRLTDHRINLTLYNLDFIINGNLDKLIESLVLSDNNNNY